MKGYLLVDFGSTYTKLTLVNIEEEAVVATASSYTTIETGVVEGYRAALKKMGEKIDLSAYKDIKTLACSSAAGGLQMISVGCTPYYTVEAAKKAALGAGARLLQNNSYLLTKKDVEKIKNQSPDMILLTGGAEGGNRKYLIENARTLFSSRLNIPIIIAGNTAAYHEIRGLEEMLENEVFFTENVMPDVHRLNTEPVREVIRTLFMKRITHSKGMREVEQLVGSVLMPTPTAVLKAATTLSIGTDKHKGLGELMVVDVGGATTDIHTISKGFYPHRGFEYDGLEEPLRKRTVEGDLGMRYSAMALYESLEDSTEFANHEIEVDALLENCQLRFADVRYLPTCEEQEKWDLFMAELCAQKAIDRHRGKIRRSVRFGKEIWVQEGKDLSGIQTVILTGGVFAFARCDQPFRLIRQEDPLGLDSYELRVDKNYLLSAMGLLSMEDPELAFTIMEKNIISFHK